MRTHHSLHRIQVIVLLMAGIPALQAQSQNVPGPVLNEPPLTTTTDLLRGFSSEELAKVQKLIPQRPEPPLAEAVPRIATIQGKAFLDTNGNGKQEANEKGLANITVSDCQRLEQTGSNGEFSFVLRFDDKPHHRFITLTRPNGYRLTGSFYVRIPYDENRAEYSISFGLQADPKSAKKEFWFISSSDSQFTAHHQMLPTAKDYAQITSAPGGPAFLVTAGDLTMNGSQFEWDMYDYIRRSSQIPVYEGFGGHDGNCLDPRCTVSFEQRIGPPYYSWNYGGVHFIQLVTETGYLQSPAKIRQQDWITADLKSLAPGTPVIAVSHYPLDPAWFDQRKKEGINVIAQIGAHYHVVHAGSRQGIPVMNSAPARGGDWGAYSRTYRWTFVDAERKVSSQLRVSGQYKRLKLLAPGTQTHADRQPLVVLAYDSALLVKSVSCTWTSPSGKTIREPLTQQGDWSWHGSFTPGEAGKWQCALVATDVTGKNWERSQTITVDSIEVAKPAVDGEIPWVLGGTPARRLKTGPNLPLMPLWVSHTGSRHVLHNSPVTAGGRVYVSVGNPNAHAPGAGILCLDAKTGKTIWKAPSPHGDIRGPVTVHEGTVYTITAEGWVAAYDARTGNAKWVTQINPDYKQGRPLAINNTPAVPTAAGLLVSDWTRIQYLLDYTNGKQIRSLDSNVGSYAAFATVSDDRMFTIARGVGASLELSSGKTVWKYTETSRSTSAPLLHGDKLYFTSSGGICARTMKTGDLVWQTPFANAGYQNPIPIVWDDQLLVNGTNFRSLDLATGKVLWQVNCGREADRFLRSQRQTIGGSSTPLIAGDHAFFGHDDTSIRAVDRQGQLQWEYRLGTPIKASPTACGNLVFVHDFAGNLWCFAGTNGGP
ncbi:MAG: PQQ-binding-like beta-propeller repeat protein [Planctomycetaceae bacterium]|nr:PQQ-binding-like beta-propeller repeat protein [Planctomycetaceae bacterium]